MNPFVSVVIPVLNDSARLVQCLLALQQQTYSSYEIIVVDNNSTEDIHSICQWFGSVHYHHESQPGSYAARNRGIRAALGDILAFTDSDCIPDAQWIAAGVDMLQNHTGLIAGQIQFFFQKPQPNVAEYVDSITFLRQRDYASDDHFATTGNAFVWRSVIDQVGMFRSDMQSMGDKEFGLRVWTAGYPIVYAPQAVVHHPARTTLRALLKKARFNTRGNHQIKAFRWKDVLQQIKPLPIQFFHSVWIDPNLPTYPAKLQFVMMIHCIKYTAAWVMLVASFTRS